MKPFFHKKDIPFLAENESNFYDFNFHALKTHPFNESSCGYQNGGRPVKIQTDKSYGQQHKITDVTTVNMQSISRQSAKF